MGTDLAARHPLYSSFRPDLESLEQYGCSSSGGGGERGGGLTSIHPQVGQGHWHLEQEDWLW